MASGEFSTSPEFIFTTKSALYSVVNILRDNCVGDVRGFNPFPTDGVKMFRRLYCYCCYWKFILLKLDYVLGSR
jgi:hypothetical protein